MFKERNNKLRATFKFKDFKQAFAFMTECAMYIEQQNHHPEWSNVYNTVKVALCTHDAGDVVTKKDQKLAKAMTAVYEKYKS